MGGDMSDHQIDEAVDEAARIAVEGHGAYEPGFETEVPGGDE
jgi:hypothetical protein